MQNFNPLPIYHEPDITLAGHIEVFENVWQDSDTIIKMTEDNLGENSGLYWHRATTIGQGIHQDKRTNMHIGITSYAEEFGNNFFRYLHNRCNEVIQSAAYSYNSRRDHEQEFWQTGYNMLRYETGQEYKAHFDGHTGTGRYLSAILYLNDDYEGGEIEFPDYKVKLKPQPGMLILFPSAFPYRHIAHPVKNGTKYAIVTWLTDRPL
jgi:hypothetical protein